MAKLSGILWDNDGVLVDTERHFYDANRTLLLEHGVDLSERDFFNWYLADNCGAWHLLADPSPANIVRLRAERNARYTTRLLGQAITPIAGVREALAELAPRVAMGVVTSASAEHFDIIHRDLGLRQHFRFVLTDDTYVNSKPSPEPYLLGLSRLGLAPEQCIVVEDSPRGLQAATAAGMRCLILRNALTHHHDFAGAYHVADDMAELHGILSSLI